MEKTIQAGKTSSTAAKPVTRLKEIEEVKRLSSIWILDQKAQNWE